MEMPYLLILAVLPRATNMAAGYIKKKPEIHFCYYTDYSVLTPELVYVLVKPLTLLEMCKLLKILRRGLFFLQTRQFFLDAILMSRRARNSNIQNVPF